MQNAMKGYRIRAGWMIDGSGGPCRRDVFVYIQGGRIDRILDAATQAPCGEPTIDLSGCTILPGLIDAHVHLFMSGTLDPRQREQQLTADDRQAKQTIQRHLDQHIAAGILAVRDGGDHGGFARQWRDSAVTGDPRRIRVNISGRAWRRQGRYGKLIGRPPDDGMTLGDGIRKESGRIDQVKIVNSGLNSLTQYGKQTAPQFSLEEMQAAVDICGERKTPVMVHANGEIPVEISVRAGCDSIEHGFFMGSDNLHRMSEKQTFWVPTAVTMKAYAESVAKNNPTAAIARKNLDHQLSQMRRGREIGVRFAVGTDAGSPGVHHGKSLMEELKLFRMAGFSLEETIQACCFHGARLLGLENCGCLRAGWEATCIAVPGEPNGILDRLSAPCAWFDGGAFFVPGDGGDLPHCTAMSDTGTSTVRFHRETRFDGAGT